MDKVELDRVRKIVGKMHKDAKWVGSGSCLSSETSFIRLVVGVADTEKLAVEMADLLNAVPALLAEVDRLNKREDDWMNVNIELQRRVCGLENANKSLKNELDFSVAAEKFNAGELERVRNTRDLAIDRMRKMTDERIAELCDKVGRRTITDLVKEAHQNAVEHGFWDKEPNFGELIALCHSELSEALESHRDGHAVDFFYGRCKTKDGKCIHGENAARDCTTCKHCKPEGVPTELADCVIRIFDLCGHYGIDLEAVIDRKMAYNKTRERLHGKGY